MTVIKAMNKHIECGAFGKIIKNKNTLVERSMFIGKVLVYISDLVMTIFFRFSLNVYNYFNSFLVGINAIMSVEQLFQFEKHRMFNINNRYLFGTVLTSGLLPDYIVFIVAELLGNSKDWDINHCFYRSITRIWPYLTVRQRDLFTIIAYFMMFYLFSHLLRHKMNHMRVLMVLVETEKGYALLRNGRPMRFSRPIVEFWKKVNPKLITFQAFVIISVQLLFLALYVTGELFQPDEYSWSFRRILYLIISPPYFLMLSVFVAQSQYFVLVCTYIILKQKLFLKKLKLVYNLSLMDTSLAGKFMDSYWLKDMKNAIEAVAEIAVYNSFWAPLIGCFFISYIAEISFIFFIAVTAFSVQILILIIFGIAYVFYLFLVAFCCSRIEEINFDKFRHLRLIYFQSADLQNRSLKIMLKLNIFLEFDKYFKRSSFKLTNGYRINNRLINCLCGAIFCLSTRVYGDALRRALFL